MKLFKLFVMLRMAKKQPTSKPGPDLGGSLIPVSSVSCIGLFASGYRGGFKSSSHRVETCI
jgi:hypothetical protein